MPVRDSEAIILRSFPLGEGDRLVSFLSRANGRVRGVASGARKPKSRFGSTLEIFSYVRIWFYERETRELVRINQCDLLESFFGTQRDYASELVLALASEVTEAVLGEREVAEPNFRLLLAVGRAIKAGADHRIVSSYFALWIVRLGGWLPRLERCGQCGSAISGSGYFSDGGGVLCRACSELGHTYCSSGALELASRMLVNKLDEFLKPDVANGPHTANAYELRNIMLNVIERHIEKKLRTRKLLDEIRGLPANA
jgi:DNA repair protein RecO (recombination protein O)